MVARDAITGFQPVEGLTTRGNLAVSDYIAQLRSWVALGSDAFAGEIEQASCGVEHGPESATASCVEFSIACDAPAGVCVVSEGAFLGLIRRMLRVLALPERYIAM